MKKSRSSIPRLEARCPGLLATGGAPAGRDPACAVEVVDFPPDVDEPPCVAITVGKTNEGSGFPAKLVEEEGQTCTGMRGTRGLTPSLCNLYHCR